MEKAEIFEMFDEIREMKNNPFKNEKIFNKLNNDLIVKIDHFIQKKKKIHFNDEENFKGQCYINLKDYQKALICYSNDPNSSGMIYFKYIRDYLQAYKKFVEAKNYKFAIDSLIKLEDIEELFNYINQ